MHLSSPNTVLQSFIFTTLLTQNDAGYRYLCAIMHLLIYNQTVRLITISIVH